jgi:ABC-type transporter Mla maintaining outer membrane lipid asymmetry ATPase subunit MlaF
VIEFRRVTAGGFRDASFSVGAGVACKLLTESDLDRDLLLHLLIGSAPAERGEVALFGEALGGASEERALSLFSRMGIVWSGGGFVSNLKVWENLLLPVMYHRGGEPAVYEGQVVELLRRLGVDETLVPDYLGSLPGALPVQAQRLLGCVRAALMDPEVVIYESPFEGLPRDVRARLESFAVWFHTQRPGRTSVYLSSDEQSLQGLPADLVLRQEGGRFGA